MITKGEWAFKPAGDDWGEGDKVVADNGMYICCNTQYYPTAVEVDDMKLIAAAGTSANKLNDMGYDGAKCVEMLPSLMTVINSINAAFKQGELDVEFTEEVVRNLLDQLRKG